MAKSTKKTTKSPTTKKPTTKKPTAKKPETKKITKAPAKTVKAPAKPIITDSSTTPLDSGSDYSILKFCDDCESRLDKVTTSDKLYFLCRPCNKTYEANASDTLMEIIGGSQEETILRYENLIARAGHDPTNPRVRSKCPECNAPIVRYIRLRNTLQRIYVCEDCEYAWS